MNEGIFFTVFYQPIYNLNVFLIDLLPLGNVALAVILTTVLVKLLLFPLTKKALLTQIKMRGIEPKMEEIRKKFKDDRQALGKATLDLYKEAKVNPFASILVLVIQIPVVIALYWIFYKGGLPSIKPEILYSFVGSPEFVSMKFFIFDMAQKSWILAILAGVTQYIQAILSFPATPAKKDGEKTSFKDDFARNMQFQMKYFFPILIVIISHSLSSAVALYFVVSNIFTIGQELALKRHRTV
ncbi:MAG: YidC/Oxa1 family membrane protein insertase [Patescibacteria group bacterium]